MSLYMSLKNHFKSNENRMDLKSLESALEKEGYLCKSHLNSEGFFIHCRRNSIFAAFGVSIELLFFGKNDCGLISLTYQASRIYRFIGLICIIVIAVLTFGFNPFHNSVKILKTAFIVAYGISYFVGEEIIVRLQANKFTKLFLRIKNSYQKLDPERFYMLLNDDGHRLDEGSKGEKR